MRPVDEWTWEDYDRFIHSRAWRRMVAELCPPGSVCSICGGRRGPIVHGLRPRHPLGPSLDHIVPRSKGGHPTALDNLAPCHLGCNASKRDREASSERVTLRTWEW